MRWMGLFQVPPWDGWAFNWFLPFFQNCMDLKPGCWPRPPVNYCILIALALKSSYNGSLKVQQIYHFTRSEIDSLLKHNGCVWWFKGLSHDFIRSSVPLIGRHPVRHFWGCNSNFPMMKLHWSSMFELPHVPFPERTSPSFRRLQMAGRTPSDTTCASTAASAKPATSCAETARGSRVFGTWLQTANAG